MLSVIIKSELLDFKKKEGHGLVSGLKKLNDFGIEIVIHNFSKTQNTELYHLLKSENILISKKFSNEKIILVTKRKEKSFTGQQLVVNSKSKIKTFGDAVEVIISNLRSASVIRKTKETDIRIDLSLDGKGKSKIKTGVGFFDHMLEQTARHGNILLNINVKGDLEIDEHHTVEDTGIALGEALAKALGNKKGIKRYGYFLPMDDSIAKCAVDLGGRTYLNFNCEFKRDYVGGFPTELVEEFFRGLSSGLKANIYIAADGKNDHHKIENIFKAFAKSLNEACRFDTRTQGSLPTTKGLL